MIFARFGCAVCHWWLFARQIQAGPQNDPIRPFRIKNTRLFSGLQLHCNAKRLFFSFSFVLSSFLQLSFSLELRVHDDGMNEMRKWRQWNFSSISSSSAAPRFSFLFPSFFSPVFFKSKSYLILGTYLLAALPSSLSLSLCVNVWAVEVDGSSLELENRRHDISLSSSSSSRFLAPDELNETRLIGLAKPRQRSTSPCQGLTSSSLRYEPRNISLSLSDFLNEDKFKFRVETCHLVSCHSGTNWSVDLALSEYRIS